MLFHLLLKGKMKCSDFHLTIMFSLSLSPSLSLFVFLSLFLSFSKCGSEFNMNRPREKSCSHRRILVSLLFSASFGYEFMQNVRNFPCQTASSDEIKWRNFTKQKDLFFCISNNILFDVRNFLSLSLTHFLTQSARVRKLGPRASRAGCGQARNEP